MANTPSLQTVTLQPTLIQVGPALIYANVTKPADTATLLVSGQVSGSNDQRVFGPLLYTISGTCIGSTVGTSNATYRATFVNIDIEQALSTVEKVLTTEEAGITASVAELSAENMRDFSFPGNFFAPVAALKAIDADPLMPAQYRHTLTVGGIRLVKPQCIALISANRRINQPEGPFSYVFVGYNAVSTEGVDLPMQRSGTTIFRCRFEFLADIARTIGDQLFQMTVRSASAT